MRNASLVDLIEIAYDFPPDKIVGGPNWLDHDRFDIDAKAAPVSTAETMKVMLQSLLAERFSLVVHKDSRALSTYVPTSGRKPELKKADGSGETGCRPLGSSGPPAPRGGNIMMMSSNGVVTTIKLSADGTIQYSCRSVTRAWRFVDLWTVAGFGAVAGSGSESRFISRNRTCVITRPGTSGSGKKAGRTQA